PTRRSSDLLNSIYEAFLDDLSAGRKISKDSLRQYADAYAIRNADDALKYKFIDAKLYKDELITDIKKRLDIKEKDDISIVSITKYVGKKADSKSYDKNDVMYAYEDIVEDEGVVDKIGGENNSRDLRKLRKDDIIKVVVSRVNSD